MKKGASFYNQDYFQKHDALPLHFAQTLKRLFQKLGVKKILDVGCGTGRLVRFLNDSGFQAIGCDQSREAVKISGQIRASATRIPFKSGSFDCVTAISLIEHLTPKESSQFIEEVRRVLKTNSYFFLVSPNDLSPIKILKGKNWFAFGDPTHKIFYSPFSLSKLLKRHRFDNFRFRFGVNYETPSDWPVPLPRLPQPLAFLINLVLISSPLAYFRDSFWLLCRKQSLGKILY